jgi:myo-inositol-1(or 4)-monophosphatase
MGDILSLAVSAAKEAGVFLVDNFGKINKIESKGDRNLATDVDKEAERLIVEKIKIKFPGHGILAEESGASNIDRDYLWIIDPLDGTHNYIRNIDIFGVSIGVIHKNKFIAGVIYLPVDDELYAAEHGGGAYKNDHKIKVSANRNLKDCSISFDSSIRYSPEVMLKTLGALAKEVFNIRMLGSSARVLSYLCEGKLDFAVEFYDRPWDFAGGVCILEEAGGQIAGLKGNPLTPKTIGYIASNAVTHDQVQKIVLSCLGSKAEM